MAVEIRPARDEEMREFAYLGSVTFGESTADSVLDRVVAARGRKPEWTLCAFEDGVMAARMATLPFTMHWNGATIGCGGVSSVGTLPNYRRRGFLRTMMTQAFAEMRAADQPVAMLWASMAAIYQRFGYGITGLVYSAQFDPHTVRFVDAVPTPGRVRIVRGEEILPALSAAYDRFAPSRTLALVRDADHWRERRLRRWDESTPPNLHAVYEEDGEPLGYITYAVEREPRRGPDAKPRVEEFIAATPSAHRALIQYLLAYDLAFALQFTNLPVDDALFQHVQEPRDLELTLRDGVLVRLVDVQRALEARGYDEDGSVTFALADEMCPWNAGAWTLTVEGGQGRLKQASCAPDLTLGQRGLALLACGTLSATQLARMGIIPPADRRALRSADALFRIAAAPYCADFF
jgi:predicted acetyltransferase